MGTTTRSAANGTSRKSLLPASTSRNYPPPKPLNGCRSQPSNSNATVAGTSASSKNTINVRKSTTSIPVQNAFDSLNDDAEECEVIINANKPKPATKKSKIHFLNVTNANIDVIKRTCIDLLGPNKFAVTTMKIGLKVEVFEADQLQLLKNRFLNDGIEFFTYHTPETKPKKIVLKGLQNKETNDVKSLLAGKEIFPEEIKQMQLNGRRSTIFVLYFKPLSVKLGELQKIEYLDHVRVKWEHFQSRRLDILPQCRNCQMYGHSSINCSRKPRCLVCAMGHTTATCPDRIPRAELQKRKPDDVDCSILKCANCNGPHTANFKGCPARQDYIKVQEKYSRPTETKRGMAKITAPTNYSIPSMHSQTYSQVVRGDSADLFSPDQLNVIMMELISGYTNCKSKVDQVMVLNSVISKYCFGNSR